MKRLFIDFGIILLAVLLSFSPVVAAKAAPTVSITLQNPLPNGTVLAVGQTYTFNVLVTSSQPFVLAMALPNAFYPGRGVYWHDSDRSTQATAALLHLTVQGKNSTAGLAAVHDWPTAGINWQQGTAPLAIVVGVRFKGGQVVTKTFTFAVKVP